MELAGWCFDNIHVLHIVQKSNLVWYNLSGEENLGEKVTRFKVSETRIVNVVANQWKDENDKVMLVKQWLEDRRLSQVLPSCKKFYVANHIFDTF